MRCHIILVLVISAFFCPPVSAQSSKDSIESLLQQLGDPNARVRAIAALKLGAAIDPDKGTPPADADAVRAELGEYYKSHRYDLNHNMRSYLCMVLYPEIKRALDETVVADYPVNDVQVKDLLKGLTAVATRNRGASFNFESIRIDASMAPEKLTIHSSNSFNHATGLEVLRFIAASIGGRYDIDDTGVFIYAEPKQPTSGTP